MKVRRALRKVVQLAAVDTCCLVVLCDDGTLHGQRTDGSWYSIQGPPATDLPASDAPKRRPDAAEIAAMLRRFADGDKGSPEELDWLMNGELRTLADWLDTL